MLMMISTVKYSMDKWRHARNVKW